MKKISKKEQYLEKHCSVLEKEIETLKAENLSLKMQVLSYEQGRNESVDEVKKLLEDVSKAKNMYEKLCIELKTRLIELNSYLSDIKQIKSSHSRKANKLLN